MAAFIHAHKKAQKAVAAEEKHLRAAEKKDRKHQRRLLSKHSAEHTDTDHDATDHGADSSPSAPGSSTASPYASPSVVRKSAARVEKAQDLLEEKRQTEIRLRKLVCHRVFSLSTSLSTPDGCSSAFHRNAHGT